ncbi:MAG: bifunctional UDP-sugar hydrolase/5'-nucleotidase [Deltaproteobacteria bacterium]|nr:bifunctional UDP-sugar hydrolase/5'-nucleotidase [Deltaproteobacteria bacterium]
MRHHRLSALLSLLAILILCGCAAITGGRVDTPLALTILHTNDHHGRFWKNKHGEHGLAARKTLADRVRAEVAAQGGDVLLLDAGDINTGVPESDMLDAEPDIRGMNAMGYDAMAVGNHEFDNPLSVLRRQEAWMDFPLLSANIYNATGERLFAPYHVFRLHGLTVAVFGLTTETTAVAGNPTHVRGLTFRPAVDEARELVPILRGKADVVIALAHLGYDASGATGSVALARAVPGIDLIVDGHSHTELTTPILENGTVIVQAGEYGKYLGRVDLVRESGRTRLVKGSLLPVNLTRKIERNGQTVRESAGEAVPEDPAMLALLSSFQEHGDAALLTEIGRGTGNFTSDRAIMRQRETDIGNLACLALVDKTGADVAVMNSGGIRAGLPAGAISYRDVLCVKPFGNTICTVAMTGAEVAEYLRAAASMPPDSGSFAQFAGVSLTLKKGALHDPRVAGAPLDPAKTYTLAVESYLANGGDGYPKLTAHPGFTDTGFVDADALKDYIAAHSPLDPDQYAPTDAVRRE